MRAGARNSADLKLRAFYLARAMLAIDELERQVKTLRVSAVNVEGELARLGRAATKGAT